jgi:hypothetical protein
VSASRSLYRSLLLSLLLSLLPSLLLSPFLLPHDLTFATPHTPLLDHLQYGFANALAITVARTVAKLSHQYPVNTRAALPRPPERTQARPSSTLAQAGFWGTVFWGHILFHPCFDEWYIVCGLFLPISKHRSIHLVDHSLLFPASTTSNTTDSLITPVQWLIQEISRRPVATMQHARAASPAWIPIISPKSIQLLRLRPQEPLKPRSP